MTLAALWLAPVEGVGLVGAAATRLVTPKTAELCVLAVPTALPWPGLGDRLVREVADALRAQGAERLVARSAGGDGRRLALPGLAFTGRCRPAADAARRKRPGQRGVRSVRSSWLSSASRASYQMR
jgi:hypothetical protein